MTETPTRARTLQQSTTEGLGSILLGPSVAGYQTWASAYGANATGVRYVVLEDGGDWEEVIGNYDHSAQTVSRDTILSSSQGGSKINWPAGTRNVFVVVPASEMMSKAEDLSGLASASAARTNLGATTTGGSLFTAASASAARTTLGLGTLATQNEGTGAGDFRDNTANDSRFAQIGTLPAPSGTGLLLTAGSVPAGWTRVNETEDLVYMGAKSGQSVGALDGDWSPGGELTVDGHTLDVSEIPTHAHGIDIGGITGSGIEVIESGLGINTSTAFTDDEGGDGSHTHGLTDSGNWRPRHRVAVKITKD